MNKETYKRITSRLPLPPRTHIDANQSKFIYPKSPKKEDIIDWIIKTQFVDYYVINLIGEDDTSVDDVIQDIYLDLLEKSQEDWDRLTCQGYAVVRAYIAGVVYRQIRSSNSPSYYKYRRYNQNRTPIEDIAPSLELNILNTYEKNCTEPDNFVC